MGSGSTIAIAHLAESLFFGGVPDDILVNILCRLFEDPRDLARLACVSTRFCKVIKTVCWKFRCEETLPLLVAELLQPTSPALHPCLEPPGGWASLQKLLVCCPGIWHAGVLLENWDFGLDREIGWGDDFCYAGGFSYPEGSIVAESIFTVSGCKFRGEKSCNTCTDEYIAEQSATCAVFPDANNVEPHVLYDAHESDSVNPCAHCSEADTNSNRKVGGMNCEIEIDRSTDGKEVGMHKYECDDEGCVIHTDVSEVGMDTDEIARCVNCDLDGGGIYCDVDEGGINVVKAEIGHVTGDKITPERRHRLENSASAVMEKEGEEFHVIDCEFQASRIMSCANSPDAEVSEVNGVVVAVKGAAAQPQIYKSKDSTCMQSLPTLSNRDPLNLVSLEPSCRQKGEEGSGLVDTHATYATSREKTMQEHKPRSHKRQRTCHSEHCHVTTRPWNLSREQGNKLLANRFRTDSLYICDWPGCLHPRDKRVYKLFRGVFKNFKQSHVWRNLKDMQAKPTNVGCAFCVCRSTWDMVTTFCLKRSIEYHDDGEPVVRAYVCENGHVAGAWTDRPMYIL